MKIEIALHLSARYCDIGIFETGAELITSSRTLFSKTERNLQKELDIIGRAISDVEALLQQSGLILSQTHISAISVSVPGPVRQEDNRVKDIPAIPFLQYRSLNEAFSESFKDYGVTNIPRIFAQNDANALASYVTKIPRIARHSFKEILVVYISYGLGGAFVTDGIVRRGASGQAGEIGHMIIQPSGRLCECSGRGCWETVVSGLGLEKSCSRLFIDSGGNDPDYFQIMADARHNVEYATLLLKDFGTYLGTGLASLANIWNPDKIVIGGDFSEVASSFSPHMNSEFRSRIYTDMNCEICILDEPNINILAARNLIHESA